jgi:hypothetical protein
VARRGVDDNTRAAVDKVLKGKGRVVNARFAAMCALRVTTRTSSTSPVAGERCRREDRAGQAGDRQPHLMPRPEPSNGSVENPARESSICLVSVARNRHSVPCQLVGELVSSRQAFHV